MKRARTHRLCLCLPLEACLARNPMLRSFPGLQGSGGWGLAGCFSEHRLNQRACPGSRRKSLRSAFRILLEGSSTDTRLVRRPDLRDQDEVVRRRCNSRWSGSDRVPRREPGRWHSTRRGRHRTTRTPPPWPSVAPGLNAPGQGAGVRLKTAASIQCSVPPSPGVSGKGLPHRKSAHAIKWTPGISS